MAPEAASGRAESLRTAFGAVARHRGVQLAAVLWIGSTLAVLWLAHGSLPVNRPAVA